jgi:hypothetical protein
MFVLAALVGIAAIVSVLWDAFETILLPRRSVAGVRISRLVIAGSWRAWVPIASGIKTRNRREHFLAIYALLALIALLVVWASGLISGFAMLYWSCGSKLAGAAHPGFRTDLYLSGTTFFTLGLGDVEPASTMTRFLTVLEAGTGFGFLALVVAYLPVLYQSFSRREARITMLDEWAGSPPTAAVILRRAHESRDPGASLDPLLRDWEIAAAEILESHLSYPILGYFRSQHDNQSWLASLTAVLDTCALVIVGVRGVDSFQARLTFAIGRHALVDLVQNFRRPPEVVAPGELLESIDELRAWLDQAGVPLERGPEVDRKLTELRTQYVPYARALSELLLMPLPSWIPPAKTRYNWETTVWARTARDDAH